MNCVHIGGKIKQLRKERGFSRPKLCDALNNEKEKYGAPYDLLERTLKAWENGQSKPDWKYLPAFCQFFNTDMSFFFDDNRIFREKINEDIASYTGLTENSIALLHRLQSSRSESASGTSNLLAINAIVSDSGLELMGYIASVIGAKILVEQDLFDVVHKTDYHDIQSVRTGISEFEWCKTHLDFQKKNALEAFDAYMDDTLGVSKTIKNVEKEYNKLCGLLLEMSEEGE